jgi:hypothetical protein
MKQERTITPPNQSDDNVITVRDKNKTTVQTREDSAALFVTKFTNHSRQCVSLAKRFAVDNPQLKDSAAISTYAEHRKRCWNRLRKRAP